MIIERIRLKHFRNYDALEMTPHPGVNLLFGHNGAGKTNVLEAIHYCALGRSHRTSQDREVVQKGQEAGACGLTLNRGDVRVEIAVRLNPEGVRKKQIFVDQKKVARFSDLMGKMQCVIFSPEDLQLIREGPAVRRRFMDMMISQLSPGYFIALQQYGKALEQRNALLREAKKTGYMPKDVCAVFEEAMAQAAETIIPLRSQYLSRLRTLAVEQYQHISGSTAEVFDMGYDCCMDGEEHIAAAMTARLQQDRAVDILRGTTGYGVHREDISMTLSGQEMKQYASQGQVRTGALSLKLAQLHLFEQQTGEMPILMLDDVMSELDKRRRTFLLDELNHVQTFVTCTDESDLDGCEERRTYHVTANAGQPAEIKETRTGHMPVLREEEEPDFT